MQDPRATSWYVARGSERHGPYTFDELLAHARAGRVLRSDRVCDAAGGPWLEASTVPGLVGPSGGALAAGASATVVKVVAAVAVVASVGAAALIGVPALLDRAQESPTGSSSESGSTGSTTGGPAGQASDSALEAELLEEFDYLPSDLSRDWFGVVGITDLHPPGRTGPGQYTFSTDDPRGTATLSLEVGPLRSTGERSFEADVTAVDHDGARYEGRWYWDSSMLFSHIQLEGTAGYPAAGFSLDVKWDQGYPVGDRPLTLHGIATCYNGLTQNTAFYPDDDDVLVPGWRAQWDYHFDLYGGSALAPEFRDERGPPPFGTTEDVPLAEPQD